MSATFTLSDDVKSILQESMITADSLTLPAKQLDRKTYEAVNKVLESAGGKWNRKSRSHIFPTDPRNLLAEFLSTGKAVNQQQHYQAFYTPTALAERLCDLVDVKAGDVVLEPSAGIGNIADVIKARGAALLCVELNPESCKVLESKGHKVSNADFLTCSFHGITKVVMNPPFTAKQDIQHVTHAFNLLPAGGRLAAVMSAGTTFRSDKATTAFRKLLDEYGTLTEELPAGTFSESGTEVKTIVVVMTKAQQ